MIKKGILLLATTFFSLSILADEGMWLLPLLKQQKFEQMKAMGLKLEDYDIYSPDSASLKDAVVQFGRGCTGEIISPEGLLITNHHCGYGQIQEHSTLEKDYLTEGFWAMNRSEELPNPGLTVTFIDQIDDVTDYVKKALEGDTDPNSMNFLSPRYLNGLAKEKVGEEFLQNNPGTEVEIKAFFGGNKYYMFTKKIFSDIRLVGAPPSSIGKFGADTDNWMWPRHTGDFSLFRIYADANGNPAEYAASNVPLRPKRHLKIALTGVQENDYAMIMGFPGTTNKYYTSWEVAERRDIDNAVRINIRNLRQEAMLEEMLADPQIRIQYANKYAGSTNAHKNAIGCNWAINLRNFEAIKAEEQKRLHAWSLSHCEPNNIEAMETIESIIKERAELRFQNWMLDEALMRGIEFIRVPTAIDSVKLSLQNKDKAALEKQLTQLANSYRGFANKDYSQAVDKKIAKVLLKEYIRLIPTDKLPAALQTIATAYNADVDRYVEALFKQSIYGSDANFEQFLKKPTIKALERDPMIQLAQDVQALKKALTAALADFDASYAKAHRTYVNGLLDMYGEHALFPDANLTLRISYGEVKGYNPRDAVSYDYQTTLQGVMEKEDSSNWEFVVAPKLKTLYQEKAFGRYAMPNGEMPVAFAATTHTTGGNSGSPVMNAEGALIGINFDRNWEGVGGDIEYLPEYQRSIIVDIRYVMFIIDKYAGVGYLLDEMEIVE